MILLKISRETTKYLNSLLLRTHALFIQFSNSCFLQYLKPYPCASDFLLYYSSFILGPLNRNNRELLMEQLLSLPHSSVQWSFCIHPLLIFPTVMDERPILPRWISTPLKVFIVHIFPFPC